MRFVCNGAASEHALSSLERVFGRDMPADYVEFLRHCNGGEGFLNDEYLILWRAEELGQFNEEYAVSEHLPGIVFFGSNGGGEAFGFRSLGPDLAVVRVPFVGMDADLIQVVAVSFAQFIRSAECREGRQV